MSLLGKVYSKENFKILKGAWKAKGLRGLLGLVGSKLDQIREQDRPTQYPLILHIETTSRCNLRCPSCAHSELLGKGTDMTYEQFTRFMDQFEHVGKVILYGIGEPILHKDTFKMVDYCKERHIYTGFFTNGTLLTANIRQKIAEHGQDYLNISIDGPTKESFERQREGAQFDKVVHNVSEMVQLLNERKSPMEVAVWNCLTQENMHELPELIRLVNQMKVKKLVIQDIMFWGSEGIKENFENRTLDMQAAKKQSILDESTRIAKSLGLEMDIMMSAADGKRRCKLPWFFSYVTATGQATPCNWHGWDPKLKSFGNVMEKPFGEIWHSPDYQEFRNEMKKEKVIDFCQGCPMYDRKIVRLA